MFFTRTVYVQSKGSGIINNLQSKIDPDILLGTESISNPTPITYTTQITPMFSYVKPAASKNLILASFDRHML